MPDNTLLARGANSAEIFGNGMTPSRIATTGYFVAVAPQSGSPFVSWSNRMPVGYKNLNITISIDWLSVNVTAGAVVWDVEIERLEEDGNAMNAFNPATAQTQTDTVSGTLAAISRSKTVFTQVQFDNVAAGDSFRLKLTRDTVDVADTLIGDALIYNFGMESNT